MRIERVLLIALVALLGFASCDKDNGKPVQIKEPEVNIRVDQLLENGELTLKLQSPHKGTATWRATKGKAEIVLKITQAADVPVNIEEVLQISGQAELYNDGDFVRAMFTFPSGAEIAPYTLTDGELDLYNQEMENIRQDPLIVEKPELLEHPEFKMQLTYLQSAIDGYTSQFMGEGEWCALVINCLIDGAHYELWASPNGDEDRDDDLDEEFLPYIDQSIPAGGEWGDVTIGYTNKVLTLSFHSAEMNFSDKLILNPIVVTSRSSYSTLIEFTLTGEKQIAKTAIDMDDFKTKFPDYHPYCYLTNGYIFVEKIGQLDEKITVRVFGQTQGKDLPEYSIARSALEK